MELVKTRDELREPLREWRHAGDHVALVARNALSAV